MLAVGRKPADFPPKVPMAEITSGRYHFPVGKQRFLILKGAGNILRVPVKNHMHFRLPVCRQAKGIKRNPLQHPWILDPLKNTRRVAGVRQRPVERDFFGNLQKIHRVLQTSPALSVFKGKAEQLLHIIIPKGTVRQGFHSEKLHIFLQFRQIQGAPGAKQEVFFAPFQKIRRNRFKRPAPGQLVHLQMNELFRNLVHFPVDLRPDQLMETVCDFHAAVHFHSSDFNDFECEHPASLIPAVGRLVPLQV